MATRAQAADLREAVLAITSRAETDPHRRMETHQGLRKYLLPQPCKQTGVPNGVPAMPCVLKTAMALLSAALRHETRTVWTANGLMIFQGSKRPGALHLQRTYQAAARSQQRAVSRAGNVPKGVTITGAQGEGMAVGINRAPLNPLRSSGRLRSHGKTGLRHHRRTEEHLQPVMRPPRLPLREMFQLSCGARRGR